MLGGVKGRSPAISGFEYCFAVFLKVVVMEKVVLSIFLCLCLFSIVF